MPYSSHRFEKFSPVAEPVRISRLVFVRTLNYFYRNDPRLTQRQFSGISKMPTISHFHLSEL